MRAVVFDRPAPDASATRVGALAIPEPGPWQIAVEVACAGVNLHRRPGTNGHSEAYPGSPRRAMTLEIAGTVRALGPGADIPSALQAEPEQPAR